MPEIVFARYMTSPTQLLDDDPAAHALFCRTNSLGQHDILPATCAYSLDHEHAATRHVIRQLNAQNSAERCTLTKLVDATGEELHALAAFASRYWTRENLQKMDGFVGAGATAASTRLDAFEKAVVNYQNAMLDLRRLTKPGAGYGAQRQQAEAAVRKAYQMLRQRFAIELKHFSSEAHRARNTGTAFSNADRGILLARRRPQSPKTDLRIKVADQFQASRLASLSQFVNRLGKGMVALDAAARVDKVYEVHKEGGNWMRESSVQMTGFGLGGAAGGIVGTQVVSGGMVLAAEAGLLAAGPVGWAVLGGILLVGLAAGFTAGSLADKGGQLVAASVWDL